MILEPTGLAQGFDPCGFVAVNGGNGFAEQAAGLNALVFERGHTAGEYGFGNQRQRDAQIEGVDAGPFACAFCPAVSRIFSTKGSPFSSL